MAELIVLLTWIGVGVAIELVVAEHERHVAWFAAGALLGPLWWIVLADRQQLAMSAIESSDARVRARHRHRG